jgi:RNA-directed DNA polymerase
MSLAPSAPLRVDAKHLIGIISRFEVSMFLGVSESFLRFVLYGDEQRSKYRQFQLRKAGGGFREILVPPKGLAIMQRRLAAALLDLHKPKPSSHGFLRDRSIVTNARGHEHKKLVFNVDLKDFFPTIHIGRFIKLLQKPPYQLGLEAAVVIAQICFDSSGKLPQGAATSPIISNIVCRSLDEALQSLAMEIGCQYTRYADDLSFSTTRAVLPASIVVVDTSTGRVSVGPELEKAIADAGFKINDRKVRLHIADRRQEVTGLTVNEVANVQRKYVREMDSILHCWQRYGYESASLGYLKKRRLSPKLHEKHPKRLINVLRGKLSYLKMVKHPVDPVCRRLHWTLHDLDSAEITEPISLDQLPSAPLRGCPGRFRGWQNIVRRYENSVDFVKVTTPDGREEIASAFVVAADLMATAGHVAGCADLSVGFSDVPLRPKRRYYISVEGGRDIGLLYFEGTPFKGHTPLQSQYRLPEIGEEVVAIGYPRVAGRDTTLVVHSGTIEALPIGYRGRDRFIQTSFQSGGGLSGGPILDKRGFVLGLMVGNAYLKAADSDSPVRPYGQAIPIEYVQRLRSLIALGKIEKIRESGFTIDPDV